MSTSTSQSTNEKKPREKVKKPPDNPKDEYYTLICYVCQEPAKEDQPHTPHYGGVVCLSCRAFFRRSHQITRNPDFRCKRKNNCKINEKTRRRCQKCRFEKCLRAGLLPEAVLTEDQKKIRFRKLLEKKKKIEREQKDGNDPEVSNNVDRMSSSESSNSNADASQDQKMPSLRLIRKSTSGTLLVDNSIENDPQPSSIYHLPSRDPNYEQLDFQIPSRSLKINSAYQTSKIKNIVPNLLFDKLLAFQSGDTRVTISKHDLYIGIKSISEHFTQFAQQLRYFTELGEEDQQLLISQNTQLYIQLCLGLYFGSISASEQLAVIDQIYYKRSYPNQTTYPPGYISLENFQRVTKMLKSDHILNYYKQLISTLRRFDIYKTEHIPILAHVVLFYTGNLGSLQNNQALEELTRVNEMLFANHFGHQIRMQHFLSTLVTLATFASKNLDLKPGDNWKSDSQPLASIQKNNLVIPYTHDEEVWIQKQFQHVEQAFRSVMVGDDLTKEFMLSTSHGIKPSNCHLPRMMSIFMERILRTFQIHDEFAQMPSQVKIDLIGNNSPAGLVLIVLKAENCSPGMDQLQFGFGELDDNRWRENYMPLLPEDMKVISFKKVSLVESPASVVVHNVPDDLQGFDHFVRNSTFLVNTPWLYKLNLLLTLTHPTTNGHGSTLNALHCKYTSILRRRLEWINSTNRGNMNPEQNVLRILNGIQNLHKLSSFMQKLTCPT